jgi:hypothetical protein
MPELETLRRNYPDVRATAEVEAARLRARDDLQARIEADLRPVRTSRLARLGAVAGAAAAAAVAAVALLLGPGTPGGGGTQPAAARALRQVAQVARSQPLLTVPRAGRYFYFRSVEASLTQTDIGPSWLEPRVTESWLQRDGGRTRVAFGKFESLSARDRDVFRQRGLPVPSASAQSRTLRAPAPDRLHLPSDPDALYDRLHDKAAGHSEGTYREMFTLVGDALRDPAATTPRQRAALYEVAARIPGVRLIGQMRDRAGRLGIAVTMRNEPDGRRDTLIFDPRSGALLAEQQVALVGNGFGYGRNETIGYATYTSGIVDAVGARP